MVDFPPLSFNSQVVTPPAPAAPAPPQFYCGLDLGAVSDFTALCIAERTTITDGDKVTFRYAVRHMQRWVGAAYTTIATELKALFAQLPSPPTLAVDNTGVGIAVVDILRKEQLPIHRLYPVTITAGHRVTRTGAAFNVPKKELVSVAQSALQSGRLAIAARLREAATLKKELENFRVKINLNATESFEAWREGDHDDLVLSCCLAIFIGERDYSPVIHVWEF